jgi:large subunit ribosomal protein L28
MSRRCTVTGKGVMTGNTVSHAKNRNRRRFLPNVQDNAVYSEALGRWVNIKVTTAGLRTIEHKGGLDAYVTSTAATKLSVELRTVKKQVEKALAKKAA